MFFRLVRVRSTGFSRNPHILQHQFRLKAVLQTAFNQFGGIGRAYELFGDRLAEIMEELNARLAA